MTPVEKSILSNTEYSEVLKEYQIDSPLRLSAFWAQCSHETQTFSRFEENLNYSVQALLTTFGRHRISREACYLYGRHQGRPADKESIANTIYGGGWGKMNLGNEIWGDGWKYRGRGFLQCTGKRNYKIFGDVIGVDLVSNPDLLLDRVMSLKFACWYWKTNGLNELADKGSITSITRKINGGTLGLPERRLLFEKYKKFFNLNL